MSLLIRADATPRMGSGHVMRCLALAMTAREMGVDALLVGHVEIPWVRERLLREEIRHIALPGSPPQKERADTVLALAKQHHADSIILDGYHFDSDCQHRIVETGYPVLVVDDYGHLPEYHATILLNQNLGTDSIAYTGSIGERLLGPSYALLRPEFHAARSCMGKRIFPDTAGRILVSLGGGNFLDVLRSLASSFALDELSGATIKVLIGAMKAEEVRDVFHDCPAEIELVANADDMPARLHWADLCVTAGGSTCWELCCLGVPFLTVSVAPNQRPVIEGLQERGAAFPFSSEAFRQRIKDAGIRRRESEAASMLADGKGCSNVLSHLLKS